MALYWMVGEVDGYTGYFNEGSPTIYAVGDQICAYDPIKHDLILCQIQEILEVAGGVRVYFDITEAERLQNFDPGYWKMNDDGTLEGTYYDPETWKHSQSRAFLFGLDWKMPGEDFGTCEHPFETFKTASHNLWVYGEDK